MLEKGQKLIVQEQVFPGVCAFVYCIIVQCQLQAQKNSSMQADTPWWALLTGASSISHQALYTVQVNPAIIGGIIIDVGDKHIDLSIQSRVKRIQQLIVETV